MEKTSQKNFGVSGTLLKLLALITMTLDHIALILLDDLTFLRIIGRISFPLFAYMIAEGCRYTKNKYMYFTKIAILGIACQIVYYIADRSFFMGILITFSLSILLIFSLQFAKKTKNFFAKWLLPTAVFIAVAVITLLLPKYINGFKVDYGFWGVLLPVLVSLSEDRKWKFILCALGLFAVSFSLGGIQWWSLLALIPLAVYNGTRGRGISKNFFYIYYPLHLALIYGINFLLTKFL